MYKCPVCSDLLRYCILCNTIEKMCEVHNDNSFFRILHKPKKARVRYIPGQTIKNNSYERMASTGICKNCYNKFYCPYPSCNIQKMICTNCRKKRLSYCCHHSADTLCVNCSMTSSN